MTTLKTYNGSTEQALPVEKAGWYGVRIRYAAPGKASCALFFDGAYEGSVRLNAGENAVAVSPAIYLNIGVCRVSATLSWGEMSLYSMELVETDAPVLDKPDFSLCNPHASPACRRVMRVFKSLYGQGMLSGQHINGTDDDLNALERASGKLPALMGFDMMAFSTGCQPAQRTTPCVNEVANSKGNVDRALYWGRDRGALITLSWHWFTPTDGRDKSFYTANTDFDLTSALKTRDHRYTLLLKDIDMVSEQLKHLQNENIPVLWRPLHEAEGKWFWWGGAGSKSYIALYRLMYHRMTVEHGLNNLIWVWNAPDPDWYPGDDVVDIAGMDVYAPEGNDGEMAMEFSRCLAAARGRALPVTLSEVGVAPDPEKIVKRGLPWQWFMLWSGFTARSEQNPPDRLARVMNHPYTVTLEEYRALMAGEMGV